MNEMVFLMLLPAMVDLYFIWQVDMFFKENYSREQDYTLKE